MTEDFAPYADDIPWSPNWLAKYEQLGHVTLLGRPLSEQDDPRVLLAAIGYLFEHFPEMVDGPPL